MLFTEIGPTVVFIVISTKKSNKDTPDGNGEEEENERELQTYDTK